MAPNGNGSSKGSEKKRVGKKSGQVLAGPRKPTWTCSCGKGANWASRVSCYECGRAPPAATLKLAREVAAKLGCGISEIGKGQAAAKEEEEDEVRLRVKRGRGEAKEEEDKVGSATVLRFLQSNPEPGKPAKDPVVKLREEKEGEDVPFKRNLQKALLHKQRVEARVQQANEGLEDLLRQRQELDEEIEKRNKRVEEVQGQLAAAEAWWARCGIGSSDVVQTKLGGESQRAQERETGQKPCKRRKRRAKSAEYKGPGTSSQGGTPW
jgi:transcriptional regulator with XRE-family HTH domain